MKVAILILVLISFMLFQCTSSNIVLKQFKKWQKTYQKHLLPRTYNSTECLNEFTKNYMAMLRQDLKFFNGESKFRIKLNIRACDGDKSSWTGAKFSDIKSESTALRAAKLPKFPKPPESLDYRKLGLVTPVEDQGFFCSSCYAFAAACGLEGQVAKYYGRLVPLSPQNIVDCSEKFGNEGCNGGYIADAFEYIVANRGIANNSAYPYVAKDQECLYNRQLFSARASSFTFITGDENYLKSALAAIGPLPVGMKSNLNSFYYYSNGIYDDSDCTNELDHAVCLVGYGTDNSTGTPVDYWIAKNSWSTDWGEDGYFRLKMGSNLCGIRDYVVYPNICVGYKKYQSRP